MGQQPGRRPLKGLSKTAEAAVLSRRLQGRFSLNRWLRILKELARYDEAGDLLRAQARKRATVCGMFLFLALFAIFLSVVFGLNTTAVLLGGVALIAVALLVTFLVRSRRLGKLDLADDFRTVLIPFLVAIREDVPAGHKVKLSLDLAGPTEAKRVREGDLPPQRDKKRRETVFSDPWCHLEAPLVLGSQIELDIVNVYTRRDIRWKTSRGKHKRKLKWKKRVVVRAGLHPDARRFAFDPAAATKSGMGAVRLSKRLEGESAVLKAKKKFKAEGSDPPRESIGPKELVAMFLRLGSMIRPLTTGGQAS